MRTHMVTSPSRRERRLLPQNRTCQTKREVRPRRDNNNRTQIRGGAGRHVGKQHAGRPGRGKRAPAAGKGIAYASSASAASASSLGCHNDQRLDLTEHPRGWWHKAAESIAVRPLWTEAYGWLANTAGVANPRENERHARASQLATHFHAPAGERRRWYHGPVLLQLLQKHVCHQRP